MTLNRDYKFTVLFREGEVDGIHYNFVNIVDMEKAIARGEFVEYAKVHTNMYGTSVVSVKKVRISITCEGCDEARVLLDGGD